MIKSATTKGTSSKDVDAVVNAVQILRYLAHADGPQDVAAIVRATGINPSSAFNILRTLSNKRLTFFDDAGKTYQLGLGLSESAVGFVGRDCVNLIQPELERPSLTHHTLIALWQVTDDAHICVIALAAPPIAHVNVVVDTRLPELVGAARCYIAGSRELLEDELRRRLTRVRWENSPNSGRYQAEATEVVKRGQAINQEHLYRGVNMAVSAIIDRDGQPHFIIFAIGISVRHQPNDLERIGTSLWDTARFVSRVLFPQDEVLKEKL